MGELCQIECPGEYGFFKTDARSDASEYESMRKVSVGPRGVRTRRRTRSRSLTR